MKPLRLVLSVLFHSLRALGRSHSDLVLENIALRQQLAVYSQTKRKPRLRQSERVNLSFTPAERAALESAADGKQLGPYLRGFVLRRLAQRTGRRGRRALSFAKKHMP